MAFGVLAEAGGRYLAERARGRLAQQERAAEQERAVQVAQEKAQRLARAAQARRERQWRKLVADPGRLAEHLRVLPVQEVANHWAQAAAHPGNDQTMDAVRVATEKELRVRLPSLMERYDHRRASGVAPSEAMREAVMDMFGGKARAHGGKRELLVLDQELEAELRQHAGQLDPASRARWLHAMEEQGWSPESVAWAETMLTRSEQQRRTAAAANASAVDDPATSPDEHTDGLVATSTATGRADDLARDATAEAGAAGHPSTRQSADRAGQRVLRSAEPARLVSLSFATPAQAVLRPTPPVPVPSHPPAPGRSMGRGPAR